MEIVFEVISVATTLKALADQACENKEQAANLAERCAGFESVCRKLKNQRDVGSDKLHGLGILRDTLIKAHSLLQTWATPRSKRFDLVKRGVAFVKRIAFSADEMEQLTKVNEDLQRASGLLHVEVQIDTAAEMSMLKGELMALREEHQGEFLALRGSFQELQASQTAAQIAAAVKALSRSAEAEYDRLFKVTQEGFDDMRGGAR